MAYFPQKLIQKHVLAYCLAKRHNCFKMVKPKPTTTQHAVRHPPARPFIGAEQCILVVVWGFFLPFERKPTATALCLFSLVMLHQLQIYTNIH